MSEGAGIRLRGSWAWAPVIVGTSLCCSPALVAASEALTAAEIEAVIVSVEKCWNPPEDANGLVVRLEVEFQPDATLAAQPRVVNRQPSEIFDRLLASALAALDACQPLDLPARKYDVWHTMNINFDTRFRSQAADPAAGGADGAGEEEPPAGAPEPRPADGTPYFGS